MAKKNSKKNKEGNSLKGKVIVQDSKNCYLRSEGRLIVGIDLNDIIVVETSDAILVADKDSSQKIKKTVQLLNESDFIEGKKNKKSFRPWGSFTCIEEGNSWQVKRLEIKPKASICDDANVLFANFVHPISGSSHQEKLESFYRGQASSYDVFRHRFLHGRKLMLENMPTPPGGVWVDLGGGTAANLEDLKESMFLFNVSTRKVINKYHPNT